VGFGCGLSALGTLVFYASATLDTKIARECPDFHGLYSYPPARFIDGLERRP
jgi:hypothetical protein